MERREAVITGVVLAIMCGVIAGIALFGRQTEIDLALNPGAGPVIATPTPVGVDLDRFVDEAIAFIETSRGQEFLDDPIVVALSDAEFVARVEDDFADDFAEDPELLASFTATHRALGTIGRLESFDEVMQSFGAAGILGFYDPSTDELVVRQVDDLSLLTKSTIVHELAHAFDDQHFDLDRPEYDDRTDEVPWTFRAIAEGSASWVEEQWEETLSADDRQALVEEELSFADPGIFNQFELSFLFLQFAVYELGGDFVADLQSAGGNNLLDDAIESPPPTSEQLIEPGAFDAGEVGLEVPAPDVDGEVLLDGVGGQVLIRALFQGAGINSDIEWGGDWLVIWSDGGLSCLRWDLRADSPVGLENLEARFQQWARLVGSASVRSLDSDTIRVDRCV